MRAAGYKNYVLAVLMLILAFNYVDRLALGLVLQNIKIDLQLSDTQLGLLTGIAFALFYAVMGIPIARWADRGNRVTIISITTLLWSAMMALCGLAGSFLQLLLIRVGVAVGEAGCIPPAHSLIADYFNRSERPRAVAIYTAGGPLSFVIGYFLAGWLNEYYGWRVTFMLLSVPGVILAGVAWFTLKEPRRSPLNIDNIGQLSLPSPNSLLEVCATLWANKTFRHLLICVSVLNFFGYGILQWQPSFFIRSYGIETGELGAWLALVAGLGGLVGTYVGGELASRYAAQKEPLQLKVMAIAYCSIAVIYALIYLSPNKTLAFCALGLATLGHAAATNGPMFAMIQTLVPPRMRATSLALIFLFANLIGMGLGPLAAGALSDAYRPWVGEESLRYALITLCPGYFWCAWHLWRASQTVWSDLLSLEPLKSESQNCAESQKYAQT